MNEVQRMSQQDLPNKSGRVINRSEVRIETGFPTNLVQETCHSRSKGKKNRHTVFTTFLSDTDFFLTRGCARNFLADVAEGRESVRQRGDQTSGASHSR